MIEGIFICNIYDPRKDDFGDVFFKNINNKEKRKELKKIFDSYISKVKIGDPQPTSKLSKEELLNRNIVGLYTNNNTDSTIFNLFSNVDYNEITDKKGKRKKNSREAYSNDDTEFLNDDISENLNVKNIAEEGVNLDINYIL